MKSLINRNILAPKNDEPIKLIKSNPSFSYSLLKLLSDDLKRAEDKIIHMAQKNVPGRVAEALLLLREAYGCLNDETIINTSITRKNIGNIAGTTTETTIRILSGFQKDKIIKLEGKNIKILSLNKLIHVAGFIAIRTSGASPGL